MDLQSYLRVIRKRWRVIVATLGVVLVATALVTFLTPKKYESQVQFFVSTADSSSTSDLAQGGTFTQQRVKSYTELITTPKVLAPVAEKLGITDVSKLSDKVSAQAPPDTVLIDATVIDESPDQAHEIAQSLATEFPKTVREIEKVSEDSESPVKVTTVREPTVNESPVSPRPLRNLGLAVVLGLLLGLGLALLRDRLDTRVRTADDATDVTSAPLLGAIPFDADTPQHPLSLVPDSQSRRGEAFRTLRTNLQFVDAGDDARVIVLSSSIPGEGKSTTAANLAMALGESGATVCLVEGDLRRPRLLDYLGMEGGVGVTDVLIGRVDVRDVLQQFGRNQLWVIGSGQIPPNPSELLGSTPMQELIEQLAERFEYVIIDAPPLAPVTDAAILARFADGAVLVTGAGLASRSQVSDAVEALSKVQAKLMGVVLNRAPATKGKDYDGYYDYQAHLEQHPEQTDEQTDDGRSSQKARGRRFRMKQKQKQQAH